MHLALFEVLITRAIANEAGLGIAARYHIGCISQLSSHKFIDKISDTRLFLLILPRSKMILSAQKNLNSTQLFDKAFPCTASQAIKK